MVWCKALRTGHARRAASKATGVRAHAAASALLMRLPLLLPDFAAIASSSVTGGSPSREGLLQGKAVVAVGKDWGREPQEKGPAGGTRAPPKSATMGPAGSFREECCG